MTVRKNFVFKEEVASHLEEMAKENGQTMTAFVEEMIEQRYENKKVAKRLEAFYGTMEIAKQLGDGLLRDKSIQSIKAKMHV